VEAFDDIPSRKSQSACTTARHGDDDDLLVDVLPDRFHPPVSQARDQFVRERHVEFVCDISGEAVLRIQTYRSLMRLGRKEALLRSYRPTTFALLSPLR